MCFEIVVKRCTQTRFRYRTQTNKGLEHAASSDAVKIDCGQSFFVVSHYSRSSSSVVGCNVKLVDRGARPSPPLS